MYPGLVELTDTFSKLVKIPTDDKVILSVDDATYSEDNVTKGISEETLEILTMFYITQRMLKIHMVLGH